MSVFKRRRYACPRCDQTAEAFAWDTDPMPRCADHGPMAETGTVPLPAPGVIDDQLEGGPRWFDTMGHEPVFLESKSQWQREVEKRNLVNVVRHDSAYYARQRKRHDEELRDTGQCREY